MNVSIMGTKVRGPKRMNKKPLTQTPIEFGNLSNKDNMINKM